MADDGLRFEAWTWPLVGTLTRKFDFTKWIDSYTINDRFNDLCDGTITLSDDFPKKDQIFFIDETNHALDVGSMVRVLRGTTPIAHFLVTRSEDAWADGEPTHKLTLEGLEWILDRTTVPHYDYPADPTKEPDWIYGADTLLANAYLEDSPESKEVQYFSHTQTVGTFTITYSGQTTSALNWDATWFDVHQALEALSNIQDVVVTGDGTIFTPFEIEFLDPSGNAALLTSTATGEYIYSSTEGGVPDPAGWTKSFHPQTGEQHGEYTDFEVSADQNHTTAGTYSLKVVAAANTYPTDYPGVQQIQNVTGGRTYRGEIWVYSTTTADYRFILRTMDETAIDGAMVEQTVTANTWTKLTIPPFEVPQHISQVIFRLGLIGTGGGTFYVDDGVFAPGFPAAALGFIMNDLRTACLAQGTLGWITPTWTTTTDTDGAAWDQDLKWLVNHDQTILQLFEYMRQWNYEWRIRWDVADNRFEWDMWNPLGGGQTRANIAITGKSGVTQGNPIVKRPPGATYVRVEGELGRWGENASTTLDDVWGRLEKAVNDRQGVDSLQLDTFATRLVVREGTDTAGRAVTVEDPSILPWQAYEPGDTVTLNLAPKDTKQALRVVALVASMSPGQATPRYDVHFVSPILSNDAAMAQGLRTLWRKFNAFRPNNPAAKVEPPAIAGKGGAAPTIVVAASDATIESKARADIICTGVNDQLAIQRAIDIITSQNDVLTAELGGRVLLTEGTFSVTVPNGANAISVANRITVEGLNPDGTWIRIMNNPTSAARFVFSLENGAQVRNLLFQSNTSLSLNSTSAGAIIVNGSVDTVIENCHFVDVGGQDANGGGVVNVFSSSDTRIRHCFFRQCQPPAIVTNGNERTFISDSTIYQCLGGVRVASTEADLMISDVYIDCSDSAIYSDSGASIQHVTIDHCTLYPGAFYGIQIANADRVEISNTLVAFPGSDAIRLEYNTASTVDVRYRISDNVIQQPGEAGIRVICTGAGRLVTVNITGNIIHEPFLEGIVIDQVDDANITANNLRFVQRHGIAVIDSTHSVIDANNVRECSLETANTYDGINLSGNSDLNSVQNNRVTSDPSGTTRYGINVSAATCNNNVVNANVIGPSADFGTGVFNDAGTGTQGTNFTV